MSCLNIEWQLIICGIFSVVIWDIDFEETMTTNEIYVIGDSRDASAY